MSNEFQKLVKLCYDDISPVLCITFFELDHTEGKFDRIKYRRSLHKNWTDYIVYPITFEIDITCVVCGKPIASEVSNELLNGEYACEKCAKNLPDEDQYYFNEWFDQFKHWLPIICKS